MLYIIFQKNISILILLINVVSALFSSKSIV